ncbi:unnamed protein product [Linum trigynum]|uniref:Uncharacterized protein n=1 Tax=Linum trigynum TaxID=586398 RepID=A0AAV2DUC2_9ROSI
MAEAFRRLPKYVVLRSRRCTNYRNYLQFLWNDDEFGGGYHKAMGAIRDLEVVSPFVKLEVVPSATNPSWAVHLLCSCNNKYLEVVRHKDTDLMYVSATADRPVDDPNVSSSTMFNLSFKHPAVVALHHGGTDRLVAISAATGVAMAVPTTEGEYFEYFPWESHEEKMKAKDKENKTLSDVLYLIILLVALYVLMLIGGVMG